MSHALVTALRTIYAEWARGNSAPDWKCSAPGIVFETFTADEGPVRTRGLAELEQRMRQTLNLVWSDFRVEAEDFIDAGDKILVIGRVRGGGRGSDIKMDAPVFMLWTFRDRWAVRQQWFAERTEALEAAGLRG
jgi:ketosteroid isomerase-like protein